MKSTETKSTSSARPPQHSQQAGSPFFQKGKENALFSSAETEPDYFFKKPLIQTKLTIGKPGDKYEQEADTMADKVVQQLASSGAKQSAVNGGSSLAADGGAVQSKYAECEQEEKEQVLPKEESVQQKPIFESEAEPALQTKSQPAAAAPPIQRQEQESPQEEELPVQEEPLQMKPVFDSAAEPPEDETVHRMCDECAAGEEPTVQRKADDAEAPSASPGLESQLSSSQGGGSPLPEGTRSEMEGAFGTDFSGVRVHTDSSAVQMNRELGAQAFTHGSDVYFGAGKYDAGSSKGKELLAHELTHVVQQGATPTSVSTKTSGKRIQRFEAQHHEHIERATLTQDTESGGKGFTDAEASATYFGNWGRDLSQIMSNNLLVNWMGKELLFEVVNVVAIHKFQRELNPEDFGIYSPREHIDNPAGQINSELLRGDERKVGQFGNQKFLGPEEDISSPQAVAKLFAVNDKGLPAYLGRSIQYIEEEFSKAADIGRTEKGLMHFGNGLHTVEDFFAHSNFVEIAVSKLIKEGGIAFSPDMKKELDERKKSKEEPIETLSGKISEKGKPGEERPILTTGTFTVTDTLISIGEAITVFLNEFEPFGGSNEERGIKTTEMILGRYETLAKEDKVGTIVKSFMQHFGESLSQKVKENLEKGQKENPDLTAVKQGGGLFDKAKAIFGTAKNMVKSGMMGLAGMLMQSKLVQEMVSSMMTGIGKLPLVEIYHFILDRKNAIKNFFKKIDAWLQKIPYYKELKEFIKQKIEALKELLKPIIKGVFQFMASMIQSLFSELLTSSTYIQNQIEEQIKAHRQNGNPAAWAEFDKMKDNPKAQMAMLSDKKWCAKAKIKENDAERIRQMMQTPAYVKYGPSHSQIAKDHTDSLFFGTAATLASAAERMLRDKLIAVWQAENKNQQNDPKLKANYSKEIPQDVAKRRAQSQSGNTVKDQQKAEKEAAEKAYHYNEITNREQGETLIKEGYLEEEHGMNAHDTLQYLLGALNQAKENVKLLKKRLYQIAEQMIELAHSDYFENLAHQINQIADELPQGLDSVAIEIGNATDLNSLKKLSVKLQNIIQQKKSLIKRAQNILHKAADAVQKADVYLTYLAIKIRSTADIVESTLLRVIEVLEQIIPLIDKMVTFKARSDAQKKGSKAVGLVPTVNWDDEFSKSHAKPAEGQAMSPDRKVMFDLIRQLINHPHENGWWRTTLKSWCQKNIKLLEDYIRARNSENMHHHG